MHDTFLLKRISEALGVFCEANRLSRVTLLRVVTSLNSHVGQHSLYEQLSMDHSKEVGDWTEIIVEKRDIDDLTAVIESVEGETLE
ncbi:MAG TPA: hypothetical protein PLW98_11315 [Bacillota bacterium]|nr:hypothetical protein [Bacillota bacterium]